MNAIQNKILQAVSLLVEVRLLAKKQGESFRADSDLSVARAYEGLATELKHPVTLDDLVRYLEATKPVYKGGITVTREEIAEDMAYMLRYVIANRKADRV